MAQEFAEIKFETKLGDVNIHKSVFEWIARINVQEIEGVNIVDGSFKKGINCELSKNGLIKIDVEVRLNYGTNAERTSRLIQDKIVEAIKQMTDVHTDEVNVNVVGFQFN